MNSVLTMVLTMAANYLQSPAGQEKLVSLLPQLLGAAKGVFDKIGAAQAVGDTADQQKAEAAKQIAELVAAAAAKAEADHAAHPNDDSGFDPGIFRD